MASEQTLLAPPLKRTDKVALKQPLRNFIYSTYGQDADAYADGLTELESSRESYCVRTPDKHESAVNSLTNYYDQLVALEAKLPFGEGQVNVRFTWYDCFNKKEGFFSSSAMKCSMANGAFERLCVLFNIAALQGALAASQNLDTDVGLKLACKYFGSSAGLFLHLRDQVFAQLTKTPTPDMSSESLAALSALMLAQGQESFFVKASMDRMKPAIVAKVAAQAADYYGDALKALENGACRNQWDKTWIPIVRAKQPYFLAMTDYQQALVYAENKKFGEQISHLQHAQQMLAVSMKNGEGVFTPKTSSDRINQALISAKKENELIYNAMIPEYSRMTAIGRAVVCKAAPVPNHPLGGSSFKDSFESLVPLQVHEAVSAYDSRRQALVHGLVERLKEGTQLMNGQLNSMNLPAALEDTTGTEVPQSLLEKSQMIQTGGGWSHLQEQLNNLPDLLHRNQEILTEIQRVLDEEEREDTAMKERFKDKWNRMPSAKLTESFRQELTKYNTFLSSARDADGKVRAKFDEHLPGMKQLCLPEAEFKASIPAGGPSAQAGSQAVMELQNLMAQVTQLKSDREALEKSLEDTTFDVRSRFLSALASDGAINEEAMSQEILDELFSSARQEVEVSLQRQQELMGRVEDANGRFEQEKQAGSAVSQRESVLKQLAAAYDVFAELTANLTEGTKFYGNLTELLLKFQQKVNDLVFARNTEKDDALKDIQQSLARSGAEPAPVQPAYQQQPATTKAPPARPPPPQVAVRQPTVPPPTQLAQVPANPPIPTARPTPAPRSNPPSQAPPTITQPPSYSSTQPYPASTAPAATAPPPAQPGMYGPPQTYGYPGYAPPPGQYYMPPQSGMPPPQAQAPPAGGLAPGYGQPQAPAPGYSQPYYPGYPPPGSYPSAQYPAYQPYPGYNPPPQ